MTDPTSLPSFGVAAGEHPLRGRVLDALTAEGYDPAIDEDGDVAFTTQGQQVFVRCVDSSPPLLRVFGQWLIGEDLPGDELVRLRAANAVTGALNLVKATVHESRLVVTVDLVAGGDLDLRSLLTATTDAVLGSVHTWHATVREMAGTTGG